MKSTEYSCLCPRFLFAANLLCLLIMAGCDRGTAPPATSTGAVQVAICDVEKVSQELGFSDDLNRKLTQLQGQLRQAFQQFQQQKLDEYTKKSDEFGESPTAEEKKELDQLKFKSDQELRQAFDKLNQDLNAARVSLVKQIRTTINAPIDKVANEKGINIVLDKQGTLVAYSTATADITQDVISAYRDSQMGGNGKTNDSGDKGKDNESKPSPE